MCEPGYRTRFVDTELTPQYCAERADRVMKNPAYNAANLLRLSAMVVSLLVYRLILSYNYSYTFLRVTLQYMVGLYTTNLHLNYDFSYCHNVLV